MALAALLLSACGDDVPEAAPLPAPSPSSSPTAAPLPSPRETGTKGEVERAVLAYFAALNTAFATGDTSGFPATYADTCAPCAAFKQSVDAILAKGQRFQGARDEVTGLRVTLGTGQTGFAAVDLRVPAYRLVDASGSTVADYPVSTGTLNVTVLRTPQGWKVINLADASPSAAASPR